MDMWATLTQQRGRIGRLLEQLPSTKNGRCIQTTSRPSGETSCFTLYECFQTQLHHPKAPLKIPSWHVNLSLLKGKSYVCPSKIDTPKLAPLRHLWLNSAFSTTFGHEGFKGARRERSSITHPGSPTVTTARARGPAGRSGGAYARPRSRHLLKNKICVFALQKGSELESKA